MCADVACAYPDFTQDHRRHLETFEPQQTQVQGIYFSLQRYYPFINGIEAVCTANISAPRDRLDELLTQLVAEQRLLSPPEMDYTSHYKAVKEDMLKFWTDTNRILPTLSMGECRSCNNYITTAKENFAANVKLFKINKNRAGEKVNN